MSATQWIAPLAALLAAGAAGAQTAPARSNEAGQTANGYVFHDRNGNGRREAGEEGLGGVRVSNQRDVVKTDRDGRYALPVDDDTILFVVKPKGWRTPVDELNLPRFYHIHKPKGSPKQLYPGVAPTGSLPASVDFPLTPQKEPKRFRAVFFGDTQVSSQEQIDYLAHDLLEELIGTDAAFGLTLGDNANDQLTVLPALNRATAAVGIPWYHVLGNHDENYDSVDDSASTETFQSVYGPPYYSFDYGPVHFIVLDDVVWDGSRGAAYGRYSAGLGAEQLEFVKNDLALVPKSQLVVLTMHIPLTSGEWNPNSADREALFRLLEPRPNTLSVSGHTHTQYHDFAGEALGWRGAKPHHHFVNATACGSWWTGAFDEQGIPHTTMRDGAPNGYSVLTFDGNKYSIAFKAARRPADHQMTIHAPEEVDASAATPVYANVFAGSERSVVEMRAGTGPWTAMKQVREVDPYYKAMKDAEEGKTPPNGPKLPGAGPSGHLWSAPLPAGLAPGVHTVTVRTTDMFGQTYTAHRIIRVR